VWGRGSDQMNLIYYGKEAICNLHGRSKSLPLNLHPIVAPVERPSRLSTSLKNKDQTALDLRRRSYAFSFMNHNAKLHRHTAIARVAARLAALSLRSNRSKVFQCIPLGLSRIGSRRLSEATNLSRIFLAYQVSKHQC